MTGCKNFVFLCLVALASLCMSCQRAEADNPLHLGNLISGMTHAVRDLTGSAISTTMGATGAPPQANMGGFGDILPNTISSAHQMVSGLTRPVMNMIGSFPGAAGGIMNPVGEGMRMATSALSGLASGSGLAALGAAVGGGHPMSASVGLHNAVKREATESDLMVGAQAEQMAHEASGAVGAIEMGAHLGSAGAPGAMAALAGASPNGLGPIISPVDGGIVPYGPAQGAPVASPLAGRAALAADAVRNAQAESALAGADMVAHGTNNARSASLASNAYRQAKLASARDRVNIAGTIQNSARISDAAIATHDSATKAEDSLLGSELAVDSASTVLDSDGAYIPPVTSSLLRSLPYGRLGVRSIIPKPLTYPSVLLPDVWLNGYPVNYLNVPLRMLPYTIGTTPVTNPLWASSAALAGGQFINGQPFTANNGMLFNGMFMDPLIAYGLTGGPIGTAALAGSSIMPVLANGQYEAQDEVAAANLINSQQLAGAGMSATYNGYARMNPVPMITGSVSDANLMPPTIAGTTYPIGSALVIEPRDSFFQDYVDNASSRQNYDEREQ